MTTQESKPISLKYEQIPIKDLEILTTDQHSIFISVEGLNCDKTDDEFRKIEDVNLTYNMTNVDWDLISYGGNTTISIIHVNDGISIKWIDLEKRWDKISESLHNHEQICKNIGESIIESLYIPNHRIFSIRTNVYSD